MKYCKKRKKDTEGKIKHKITEIDNIKFHSAMESRYYLHLKKSKEQGIVKEFELQPKFLLQDKFIIVNGEKIEGSNKDFAKIKRKEKAKTIQAIYYISDFKVTYTNGEIVIVDVKGIKTKEFGIKEKLFKYKYPNLKLEVVIEDKMRGWISFDEYKKLKKKG